MVLSKIVINGQEIRVCLSTVKNANYLAKDMEPLAKATTDDDCLKYCEDSNECTANSFRPKSEPKCWILNGDFLIPENDLKYEEGVTTNLKQNCDGETIIFYI